MPEFQRNTENLTFYSAETVGIPTSDMLTSREQSTTSHSCNGTSDTMAVKSGWKTNTVMAGMFSMLNNSHLRLDGGQSGSNYGPWDDVTGGRMTPMRTPLSNRRSPQVTREGMSSGVKYNSNRTEKLPRPLRKKRFELHPLLRRSVCVLILAAIFCAVGILLILIDSLLLQYFVSTRGLTILSIGLILAIVGCLWLAFSKKRLRTIIQRAEKVKLNKAKDKSKSDVARLTAHFPRSHSTKWPSKCSTPNSLTCEFRIHVTTPDGHIYGLNDVMDSSSDDDVSRSPVRSLSAHSPGSLDELNPAKKVPSPSVNQPETNHKVGHADSVG